MPTRPRRTRPESIVPMINVVFLLLIFFLMTAEIAPPEPFPVALPTAEQEERAEGDLVLHISAGGEVAFGEHTGEAAIAAVKEVAMVQEGTPLELRADNQAKGAVIAALLTQLGQLGVTRVALVTAAP
ncbi:biopolymer transporter ExbD [Actibacterium sp. 188UL27-1]|uniref:ExbD/TolR family protein n=1 Tax=Actibacterium sp. 188UL27-1 TaxID=2786961 RepID=UPI001EF46FB3|nr:biopolymer transporter ExbD [Actibacterium sp. 188UL27-1]